jgi:hypothetical protein
MRCLEIGILGNWKLFGIWDLVIGIYLTALRLIFSVWGHGTLYRELRGGTDD